jgi:hypothetical protein
MSSPASPGLAFSALAPAKPTVVYDTYWRFASERQEIFFRRWQGQGLPWTSDPILSEFKFTNAYRASESIFQTSTTFFSGQRRASSLETWRREYSASRVFEGKEGRENRAMVFASGGKAIRDGRNNCGNCAVMTATERLANVARIGRVASHSPEARARHAESERRQAKARAAWDASSQPTWLTSQLFSQKIQPLLTGISTSAIRTRIGVSRWYAGRIREGYRPHPRHWQELARLVGISAALQ